ncbi:MAG: phenylalanine--tRNA ligase subunit beta [Anaerolineales bacterium]|nr:phenylalanine--tRNA ligase subunit beta [Anaerolineales bacterium]
MKIPISWLKDFIDLDGLSVEDIARKLTLAGMEVDEILYVGLPMPIYKDGEKHEFKTNGIGWDREKIVVAEVREVKPHPNADKLTLLDLYDGEKDQVVLTGAPNIFHLKGAGKLDQPLKVAYAKEGATLYDGHADGQVLMTLKRAKIRGVDSYSMVCSEKELGITEESDGIILLDDDAPTGMPLADYMGDAVLDISILPNMGRVANVVGVARELAALLGRELKAQSPEAAAQPATLNLQPVNELVEIEITNPELNPRFTFGLIRDVEIKASPYEIQRRLKLAGMRPISNIVDATNYAMLELGQPLHAFDYDVLSARAGGKKIKITTRAAKDGEKISTLDGAERTLTASNVLVGDAQGALALAGVMGGLESEVTDQTKNILLEGAAWNFINVRKTARQHNLPSEASFRFSRGVHPALADQGVKLGLRYIAEWANGKIAAGFVDEYPLKPKDAVVRISTRDVKRSLGIDLTLEQISEALARLEFKCEIVEDELQVTAPNHRLDIGEGVVGVADVLEEIARSYGYDNIPTSSLADALPPQLGNPVHEWEEHLRDLLVALGFQEIVSYRMTSVEKESRVVRCDDYVQLANPIAPEKSVLRRSLAASVLDALEKNVRNGESFSFFEIGPVFVPRKNELPDEPRKLALVMSGLREATAWDAKDSAQLDFFDMKGRLELLLSGLRLTNISYAASDSSHYLHPGKCAEIKIGEKIIGAFGELHPLVKEKYELSEAPVLAAEFDLATLRALNPTYGITPVSEFPPVYEDIAVVVDETVPAEKVEALIRQTGGRSVANVRLFDLYRDEKIGAGKKSLAYNLTYQAEKTLTDSDAAAIRNKIVKRLEKELGAKLRS